MSLFNNELAFVHLLANLSNQQQIQTMLKHITASQYSLMRTGARFILDQTVPLRSKEYQYLEPEKNFVRKLATHTDQIASKTLISKVQVLSLLAKKLLEHYEAGSKSGTHSKNDLGRVEVQNQSATGDDSTTSDDTSSSSSSYGSDSEEEDEEEKEEEEGEKTPKF